MMPEDWRNEKTQEMEERQEKHYFYETKEFLHLKNKKKIRK